MRHKGCILMAVFALLVGFVAPVWAGHTADPLEEEYSTHVLPYYKVDAGWQSYAILADTSFNDPQVGCPAGRDTPCSSKIHLYFFNQDCGLVRDDIVTFTANDVVVRRLNDVSGIPNEGVVFADADVLFSLNTTRKRFLAYIVLINPTDNTLTRIDSIPFDPFLKASELGSFTAIPNRGHWTRYDPVNTTAATFGDSTLTTLGEIRTTLMFFNALGGGVAPTTFAPIPHGAIDTLREFMLAYGRPRSPFGPTGGDWVTTGSSTTADVTPGVIELNAFDGDENFLGSFRVLPRCFERVRLKDLFPVLATPTGPQRFFVGHIIAFALPNVERGSATSCGPSGRCSFSGFQETVVEGGAVDLIFSGYMHHSHIQGH